MSAIDNSLSLGIPTVKVNVVVMKGFNEDELVDFVEFTKDRPIEVRFIEFMPFDSNEWSRKKMISAEQILKTIETKH